MADLTIRITYSEDDGQIGVSGPSNIVVFLGMLESAKTVWLAREDTEETPRVPVFTPTDEIQS